MKHSILMKYMLPVALILIIVISVILSTKNKEDINIGTHEAVVQEVIQADSYTYIEVSEGNNNYWLAIVKQPVSVGEKVYFVSGLEQVNMYSKELDRTFPLIYFVQEISRNPGGKSGQDNAMPSMQKPVTTFDSDNKIEPDQNGISIGQLFENPKEYSGQKIIIRGKVVKVNNEIMGKNWVHIQDGTQSDGKYDLTLTSMETVQIGDTLSFEGTVVLDKDFGAGYKYDIIIEDAELINLP